MLEAADLAGYGTYDTNRATEFLLTSPHRGTFRTINIDGAANYAYVVLTAHSPNLAIPVN